MLALPYKRFLYEFNGDFTVNGIPLLLRSPSRRRSAPDAVNGDTGSAVWDAAIVLARFFESNPSIVENKVVLELGSGLGLCGMSALLCGAKHVFLSDLEYILASTSGNVEANGLTSRGTVLALDWSVPDQCEVDWSSVAVIIASDVIWIDPLVQLLSNTLKYALSMNPAITVYISNQRRSDIVLDNFRSSIKDALSFQLVHDDGNLHVYKLDSI